ncbi:ribosomal protein S6 kinase delta-1 [Eucyclogobius newberryi]|uniref:ribosomal protein S6 kinase delta-1 n=1 Tax=Eucyclogobius newberryi TaxID=166745 RepID=UPI003B59600A
MISQRDKGELARFYTVTDPKKHTKGYTVYKVTARIISRKNPEDVQEITVWKRYNDFRKLHQNLWQLHKNVCSQSELFPPFAKAKVFGRFDDTVIEERRQCSEDLLQFSANIPALYSSQHIQEFFKGGEVHDGSELIGPAEPLSDLLADTLSDCSSDVQRDISGAEDLTLTSDYGGPSSDSDLTSLAVDTDSLAEIDDGMASGRTSPNLPQRGATNISSSCSPRLPSLHARRSSSPAPVPASSAPNLEVTWALKAQLFPGSVKGTNGNSKDVKSDYLDKATELISLAVQREKEQDYQAAFSFYRSGVDLLLQGVQGEPSATRREAVKKKTAEYLMQAEQISCQHLKSNMGQGSTQTVAMAAQCCTSTSREIPYPPSEELRVYRVLGIIDKVLLVMDKRTQETFILKGLRRSSDCGKSKRIIMPHSVPYMVQLKTFIVCEDTVFLLLQYAEGGKLWSHVGRYLRTSSPEESFDIPFIQKSHITAVHSPQHASAQAGEASSDSGTIAGLPKEGETIFTCTLKSAPPLRIEELTGAQSDSAATSEDECSKGAGEDEVTNSYLALCIEYEQEKIEVDALVEEEERSEQEILSLEVPNATTSSRSRSLLSNDSLSSPISSQELGFFTESSDRSGLTQDAEGQDHSDVFSPLPSPAVPLSLDQSKHTPMEFSRIDSKDSGSEVPCVEMSHKQPALFSDLGSEATEDLPELAQEVQPRFEFWGLGESDKDSHESIPVISFKEAIVQEEGQPPDLLVNLPVPTGAVDCSQEESDSSGVFLGLEASVSPQSSIQPDVLLRHSQAEDEEEVLSFCTASATGDTSGTSSSPFMSLWDNFNLAYGEEASEKIDATGQNDSLRETLESSSLNQDSPDPCASVSSVNLRTDPDVSEATKSELGPRCSLFAQEIGVREFDEHVSRLFAELEKLSVAASKARIPEEFVRRWASELVSALDSLHQEGILCRDLNPNNILLDHQGHIQLTYFCSWTDVEESCDKEAVANMYCAPEVGGIAEETPACDWWSLGAILFELLTGMSLLRCHPAGIGRHTVLNIPECVSEEARSLLEQLLQYNPIERLGAGAGGADDIKSHPFFSKMDWPDAAT